MKYVLVAFVSAVFSIQSTIIFTLLAEAKEREMTTKIPVEQWNEHHRQFGIDVLRDSQTDRQLQQDLMLYAAAMAYYEPANPEPDLISKVPWASLILTNHSRLLRFFNELGGMAGNHAGANHNRHMLLPAGLVVPEGNS